MNILDKWAVNNISNWAYIQTYGSYRDKAKYGDFSIIALMWCKMREKHIRKELEGEK